MAAASSYLSSTELRPRRGAGFRVLRALFVLFVILGVIGLTAGLWLHGRLTSSLAQLDGERGIAGLAAPVEVERDDLGVPTIHAANRLDAARALGFLHAQDRFFQMDLLRRQAAGELAEIIGRPVLKTDRQHRVHRFRERARQVLAGASPEDRALLMAYTDGVNAGLSALGSKPFEY